MLNTSNVLARIVSLPDLSVEQTRILRFGFVVASCFVLSVVIPWPLAMVSPIVLAKILGGTNKPLTPKMMGLILFVIALSFWPFLLVGQLAIVQPGLALLLLFMCFYGIFYLSESGKLHPIIVTFLLMGITALPLLTLVNPKLSVVFSIGFLFAVVVALGFAWLGYFLFPDPPNTVYTAVSKPQVKDRDLRRSRLKALASTCVIFPLAFYFYATQNLDDVIILVFVALLAQELDLATSLKKGTLLVATNIFGGLIALAAFIVLSLTPTLSFLYGLMLVVCLVVGRFLFSRHALSPFFAAGFSTTLVLMSTITDPANTDFTEKFIVRIVQLTMASGYIVLAMTLISGLTNHKNR